MKAILLVRVSTQQQQLDEQTSSLINYAITKGYSNDNLIIIEDKESALKLTEEERNGLNTMKAYIANDSSINAVFVWELSRLFRQQKTGYSLREYFISNQIQLFCYSPNFQLLIKDRSEVDGAGSINFALFAEMADAEMRNKKARFHRSKIKNAKTAKYSGGFIKYGYYVDKLGYYQINELQAELIRYIFSEYEKGRSTYNILKELKERGITQTHNFVKGILKSDAYTGLSNAYKMQRIYPPIITTEQFENCQRIAKAANKNADKAKEIYFAKKLIKCTCGCHYMAMKSVLMYMCYNKFGRDAKFYNKKCTDSALININALDSLLWHICKDLEIKRNAENNIDEINSIKQQILINEEKLTNLKNRQENEIEAKRERNNKMYFNGQIKEDRYLQNVNQIEAGLKEISKSKLAIESENLNSQKRIKILESKDNLFNSIVDKYKYFDELENDNEKFEIIKSHVKEINILDEILNTTKIVHIYLHNNRCLKYRINIKTKTDSKRFEKLVDEYEFEDFENQPKTSYYIDVKYLTRFERTKKGGK